MAPVSSRYTHVSLGSMADKIQLTDRQLKLLEQRRQRLDQPTNGPKTLLTGPPKPPLPSKTVDPIKPVANLSWGNEPTRTAPTASWDSASMASSARSTSDVNSQGEFYGQALPKKERKKLYDDEGRSYYESESEAEASAPGTVSTAHKQLETSSTALTEALTRNGSDSGTVDRQSHTSKQDSENSNSTQEKRALLKKRLRASMAEKRKDKPSFSAPPGDRRKFSLSLNRPKTKGPDTHQRVFLKTLMESAYGGKGHKTEEKAPQSTNNGQGADKKSQASFSSRKSLSDISGSSAGDKAIMRKVLERSQKKRAGNTSPKSGPFKESTARLKKMWSPKNRNTEESGSDNGSPSDKRKSPQRSRWFKGSRKVATREKRDPSIDGSHGNDEIESEAQSSSQSVSTTSHISSISEVDKEPPTAETKSMISDLAPVNRHALISRPSIINEDEIEIQVSAGSPSIRRQESRIGLFLAQAVTESLMEPVELASPLPAPPSEVSPKLDGRFVEQLDQMQINMEAEDEPEGYADFLATLKAEVAGSHSQLWESFHEMFSPDKKANQLGTGKKATFDDKTKDMVTNMRSYLKTAYNVDCMAETQLANNKMAKLNPGVKPVFGQHLLKRTKSPVGEAEVSASYKEFKTDNENGEIKSVPSMEDSINEGPESNAVEVTLGQFVRKSMSGPVEKKKPSVTSFVPMTQGKPITMKIPPKNTLNPSGNVTAADGPQSSRTEDSGELPWSGVKLRTVTSKSDTTNSSIPTSWAKVKLRSVAKEDKKVTSDGQPQKAQKEEEEAPDIRRIIVSRKKSPEKTEKPRIHPPHDTKEVIEIIDLADVPSTEENPIDLVDDSNEETPIDLTQPIDLTNAQTPKTVGAQSHAESKITTASADGSVLVPLVEDGPNGDLVKILVGKKGLVKISSKPGEKKGRVIWRHELDDVRSALLDLSASKVKLILNDGDHKDLGFATPDQCMRFANALHEMTNNNEQQEPDASIAADESIFVEQLNDEEQRVLEEFRKHKQQGITSKLAVDPPSVHGMNHSALNLAINSSRPMSTINANSPASPLSEVSGPGPALTSEEMKLAESYQKMLKLRIPKEAVRHKMEKDSVNTKVIDFVLGIETAAQEEDTKTSLTVEEERVAESYKKMLKMRIPAEAVRHKMQKDGVDEKVMAAVLGEACIPEPSVGSKNDTKPTLSAKEEEIAAMYRKMLKMMIPKEAIEHKMMKDQVDVKIIDAVLGGNRASQSKTSKRETEIPTLSDEEESMASSYRKMASLHIPKEVIRKKMETEGISKKIIASVLGEKLSEDDSSTKQSPFRQGGGKGFHWNPLVPSTNLKNSVWSKSSFDSGFLDEDDDISSHVDQFQKKPEADAMSRSTVKTNSETKNMAKLIDLSRANNIAITLKAFNDFSNKELAQIIEFVDPFEKIKGDRALFMKDLLPAVAEVKVIKSYKGEDDRLVPAEKWFREIVHIKRVEEKIHVLRTMESFRNEALALGETFERLTTVCNQVMTSERLPDLLELVRQIGNRMNGGRGKEAAGFKLDFLPRLAQTKGSDKKTTALDLVVMIFCERDCRQGLMLSEDFPDCHEVSRMQIGELLADVKMLNLAVEKCRKELDLLRKDNSKPPRKRKIVGGASNSDTGVQNPLLFNKNEPKDEEARTDISSMHKELFAKRSNFINSVLNKNAPGEEVQPKKTKSRNEDTAELSPRASLLAAQIENDSKDNSVSYNTKGAIARIEKFSKEADMIFPELEAKRDKAISACKELTEFFCETGGERMAPTLMGILSEFASNLNAALQKYDNRRKAEARRKKNEKKSETKPETNSPKANSSKKGTYKATKEKKSLVLMVNEMLKVAGDKQKQDFINGVTYDRPDSRLKEIYEAEKEKGKPVGSPSLRKNILRTISERGQDSEAALSEFAVAISKGSTFTDGVSPKQAGTTDLKTVASLDESEVSADEPLSLPMRPNKRQSIAERWSRKVEEEEEAAELTFKPSYDEDDLDLVQTDSQILASDSHDSDDRKFGERKRQEYVSRWARTPSSLVSEARDDLEKGSEVGDAVQKTRARQKALNRWARQDKEEEVDESEFLVFKET